MVKGKREADLDGLPARIFDHTLSDDEHKEAFPEGYKAFPYDTYKRLHIIPETFIVDEHHVHIYASKSNTGKIIKANRPVNLFRNSISTPALVASILNGKYVNAMPIDRMSKAYKSNGINLSTNTMANWVIKASEEYLSLVYDRMHLLKGSNPIILYGWQPSRKADHPREFLKDYSGVVVTDGYEVYHKLSRERKDLSIAGCWVHYLGTIIIQGEVNISLNFADFTESCSNNNTISISKNLELFFPFHKYLYSFHLRTIFHSMISAVYS